jgi:hypothetical protein
MYEFAPLLVLWDLNHDTLLVRASAVPIPVTPATLTTVRFVTSYPVGTFIGWIAPAFPGASEALEPLLGSSAALRKAGTSGYGTGASELGTGTPAPETLQHRVDLPLGERRDYLTTQGGNAGGAANAS